MARYDASGMTISEMREFASFAPCEQRYIRRSLDIALGRGDAEHRWARSGDEIASIRQQAPLDKHLLGGEHAIERGGKAGIDRHLDDHLDQL